MLVWLSPFLYSSVQSMSRMRGFSSFRFIFMCVTSLLSITPLSTRQSLISPPGSFSTRAYRLMSISFLPVFGLVTVMRLTASRARSTMRSPQRDTNLVPTHARTTSVISSWLSTSMTRAILPMTPSAKSSAL